MHGPILLSTWSFGARGNAAAWPALASGGSALDAVEAACCAVEADPEVDSVGFGGLPDRDGHVSLDGCVMLAPSRCGSVCAVRRFLHVVSIARAVMEKTPHVMLAGEGADAFALQQGFEPVELLSDEAHAKWEQWKRDQQPVDLSHDRGYSPPPPMRPIDRGGSHGGRLYHHDQPTPTGESIWKHHDTIGVLALDSQGTLAGACSTSGIPYKMPGRVGDSPIIGHGLYVDPEHGAAVATGSGELIIGACGSFAAVECMRRGAPPLAALREVLQRIARDERLKPQHQAAFIALTPSGQWASAALRPGYLTSVRTGDLAEVVKPDSVILES